MVKGGQTAGVKPMSIAGRFNSERERLLGMTDEERAFRKQWLKDQELSHSEPKEVPEVYKTTFNPIRRAYRWPLDKLFQVLTPALGKERALNLRYYTGSILMGIATVYWFTYYFKYNSNDWTRAGGWRVHKSRSACVEGDPDYPRLSDRSQGVDYASRGFKDCTLNL